MGVYGTSIVLYFLLIYNMAFECVFDLNNFLFLLNYYHLVDINYLCILSITILGVIPLVAFMAGSRITGKILDVGSKLGSLVGGAAGVVAVVQNSGNKDGNSGGNTGGDKAGNTGDKTGNTGGDKAGNKAGDKK